MMITGASSAFPTLERLEEGMTPTTRGVSQRYRAQVAETRQRFPIDRIDEDPALTDRRTYKAPWEDAWRELSYTSLISRPGGTAFAGYLLSRGLNLGEYLTRYCGVSKEEVAIIREASERERARKVAVTKSRFRDEAIIEWYSSAVSAVVIEARSAPQDSANKVWARIGAPSLKSNYPEMYGAFVNRFSPDRESGARGGDNIYDAFVLFRRLGEAGQIRDLPAGIAFISDSEIERIRTVSKEIGWEKTGAKIVKTDDDTLRIWEDALRKRIEAIRARSVETPSAWAELSKAELTRTEDMRLLDRFSRRFGDEKSAVYRALLRRGLITPDERDKIEFEGRSKGNRIDTDWATSYVHRLVVLAAAMNDESLLVAKDVERLSTPIFARFCSNFGRSVSDWYQALATYRKNNSDTIQEESLRTPSVIGDERVGRERLVRAILEATENPDLLGLCRPITFVGDLDVLAFIRKVGGDPKGHYARLPDVLVLSGMLPIDSVLAVALAPHPDEGDAYKKRRTKVRATVNVGQSFSAIKIGSDDVEVVPPGISLKERTSRTTVSRPGEVPTSPTPSGYAFDAINAYSASQWDEAVPTFVTVQQDLAPNLAMRVAWIYVANLFKSESELSIPSRILSAASGPGVLYEIHQGIPGTVFHNKRTEIIDVDSSSEAIDHSRNPLRFRATIEQIPSMGLIFDALECGPVDTLSEEAIRSLFSLADTLPKGGLLMLRAGSSRFSKGVITHLANSGFQFTVECNSRFTLKTLESDPMFTDRAFRDKVSDGLARQHFIIAIRAHVPNPTPAMTDVSDVFELVRDIRRVEEGAPRLLDADADDGEAARSLKNFAATVRRLSASELREKSSLIAGLLLTYLEKVLIERELQAMRSECGFSGAEELDVRKTSKWILNYSTTELGKLHDTYRAHAALKAAGDSEGYTWTDREPKKDPLVSILNSYTAIAERLLKSAG